MGRRYDIIASDVHKVYGLPPSTLLNMTHKIMALTGDDKQSIIKKFAREKGDTGSPEVQIALLTSKIEKLAAHLSEHAKDVHSRRGLLSMVAKRRRLLTYLQKRDSSRFEDLRKSLGLK